MFGVYAQLVGVFRAEDYTRVSHLHAGPSLPRIGLLSFAREHMIAPFPTLPDLSNGGSDQTGLTGTIFVRFGDVDGVSVCVSV